MKERKKERKKDEKEKQNAKEDQKRTCELLATVLMQQEDVNMCVCAHTLDCYSSGNACLTQGHPRPVQKQLRLFAVWKERKVRRVHL